MRRESTTVFSDFSEVNCFWEYDGSHTFRLQDADKIGNEIELNGEQAMKLVSFIVSQVSEYLD